MDVGARDDQLAIAPLGELYKRACGALGSPALKELTEALNTADPKHALIDLIVRSRDGEDHGRKRYKVITDAPLSSTGRGAEAAPLPDADDALPATAPQRPGDAPPEEEEVTANRVARCLFAVAEASVKAAEARILL